MKRIIPQQGWQKGATLTDANDMYMVACEVRGTTWQRLTDCYVVARQYERTVVTFVDDLIINLMSE